MKTPPRPVPDDAPYADPAVITRSEAGPL